MRHPLTALILVVVCFASLSAAAAAPQEATTSETAAAQQESGVAGDREPAKPAQNPLLPSWNMIAPVVVVPLMDQPNPSAPTGGRSVPGYNLAPGWYLTSAPFVSARWETSAPTGNAAQSALAPDWQLRAQIAFLFPE